MKIYVGNLNFKTSEDMLKEKFAEFGTVTSVNVVKDRDTGRSRGFAFVEIDDSAAAESAIASLNGKDFEGRALVVNEARARTERSDRSGGNRFGGGGNRFGGGNRGGGNSRW